MVVISCLAAPDLFCYFVHNLLKRLFGLIFFFSLYCFPYHPLSIMVDELNVKAAYFSNIQIIRRAFYLITSTSVNPGFAN